MRLVMGRDGHGFAIARLEARLWFKNAEKECPAGGPGEGLEGQEVPFGKQESSDRCQPVHAKNPH
jgi:hypothetical protein